MTTTTPISVKAFSPSIESLNGKDVGSLAKASGHSHAEMAKLVTDFIDGLINDLIPKEDRKAEVSIALADIADKVAQYSFAAKQNLLQSGETAFNSSGESHAQLNQETYQLSFAAITHLNEQLLANGVAVQVNIGDSASQLQSKLIKELKKPPTPQVETKPEQSEIIAETSTVAEAESITTKTFNDYITDLAKSITDPSHGMLKFLNAFKQSPIEVFKKLAAVVLPEGNDIEAITQHLQEHGDDVKAFIETNFTNSNFNEKLQTLEGSNPLQAKAVKLYLKIIEQHLGVTEAHKLGQNLVLSDMNKSQITLAVMGSAEEAGLLRVALKKDGLTTEINEETQVATTQKSPAKTYELLDGYRKALNEAEAQHRGKPRTETQAKNIATQEFLGKVKVAVDSGEINSKDLAVINSTLLSNHKERARAEQGQMENLKGKLTQILSDAGIKNVDSLLNKESLTKAIGMAAVGVIGIGMFFPGMTHAIMGMTGGLMQMGGMALVDKLFNGKDGGGLGGAAKFFAMNAISDFGQGKSE